MSNRPGALAQRIAAEIRAELGRQNHSRRWLAEQIHQSHVTVSRWVNGDGPMSFDALDAICEALGMTVADLLAATDNTKASGRDTHEHVPDDLLVAAA
jgi:transcriptional regulator with XRE-family HTH domain